MQNIEFRCFQVSQAAERQVRHSIETIQIDDLPAGDVVIRAAWSSLNYKDALAASGHPGVAGGLPHLSLIHI